MYRESPDLPVGSIRILLQLRQRFQRRAGCSVGQAIGMRCSNMGMVSVGACLLSISTQVSAGDWVTELYAGSAWTKKHNAHVQLPQAQISAIHEALSFDSAAVIGIRESYWMIPCMGLGVGVSHIFGPNQKPQVSCTVLCTEDGCSTSPEVIKKFDNNSTSVEALVAFRYPLNCAGCRILPYAGVGPALYIFQSCDTDNFIPPRQSSTSHSLGVKAYGGLNAALHSHLGVFLEYQFNCFGVKTEYFNDRVVEGITLGSTKGSETFVIQSAVAGISLNF